jgi:hypothetical protein
VKRSFSKNTDNDPKKLDVKPATQFQQENPEISLSSDGTFRTYNSSELDAKKV